MPKATPKATTRPKVGRGKSKVSRGEINVSSKRAREICGGSFPVVNGRKYKYPAPSNVKAWTALVNSALRMKQRDNAALKAKKSVPQCANRRKYEYVLYHCNPHSKWKRTTRNKHRKAHGLKVGDPRVVHHHDQGSMDLKKTVVLTPCEHQQEHGRKCRPKRLVKCRVCRDGKCKPCNKKK